MVDWGAVFALETPLLEIFVRGTVTYLALFLLLRRNMRHELITEGELRTVMREQGVEHLNQIKAAYYGSRWTHQHHHARRQSRASASG